MLTAALAEVGRVGDQPANAIAGVAATDSTLRTAAERRTASSPTLTPDRAERIQLVDEANPCDPGPSCECRAAVGGAKPVSRA